MKYALYSVIGVSGITCAWILIMLLFPNTPIKDIGNVGAGEPLVLVPKDKFEEISVLQEAYFNKNGEYLQVQQENKLPPSKEGVISDYLSEPIPTNYKIDVYESNLGKGYQITYRDENGLTHSKGTGPEALERTFDQVGTTTP